MATGSSFYNGIFCEITVQPNDSMRFRYVSEGTAGRIYGKNHTNENPIYPTIKIHNYNGFVCIRISCVTKNPPDAYRPHPHNLKKLPLKKDNNAGEAGGCEGVFEVTVQNSSDGITFPNLGLHCVKKGDIDRILKNRSQYGIDPFNTGYNHKIASTDLHCLRLCFEVFISDHEKHNSDFKLVSNPITDTKDLIIYKLSHMNGPVQGNQEILMFCEKILKSDAIKIRFTEVQNNEIVWYDYGKYLPSDVHKQYGIAFKTPSYINTKITHPVKVQIQLERTDGDIVTFSEPRDYFYTPNETVSAMKQRRLEQNATQPYTNLRSFPLQATKPYINDLNLSQYYENFGPSNINNTPDPIFFTSQQFDEACGSRNIITPGPSSVTSASFMDSSNSSSERYNIPVQSQTFDPEEQLKLFDQILKQKCEQNQQPILTSEETDHLDSGKIMDWIEENTIGSSSTGIQQFNKF